ncbi:formin-like protein 3 isoform X2 [Peromyscus leucopus]|uniref:formin-like protein 3 isoform X2 n=1 Tax=Peromyscus leucopus TaxID=10041 RepID=UPI00188536E6|nr:formin-like protein 3 isoform X2 [Peromyscus leucopus]
MSASWPSPPRTASRAHSPAAPEPPLPLPPPPPPPGIFSPRLPAPLRRPGGRGRARRALLTEPDSQPRSSAAGTPGRRDSCVRTAEPGWGRGRAARPATFRAKRAGGWGGLTGALPLPLTPPPTNDPYLRTIRRQGFMARQARVAAGSLTSVPGSAHADGPVPG